MEDPAKTCVPDPNCEEILPDVLLDTVFALGKGAESYPVGASSIHFENSCAGGCGSYIWLKDNTQEMSDGSTMEERIYFKNVTYKESSRRVIFYVDYSPLTVSTESMEIAEDRKSVV